MNLSIFKLMNYNITITESAIKKVRSLISKESDSNVALRVFVSGGGCSGFQYNFEMDRVQNCSANNDDNHDIEDDDFNYDNDGDEQYNEDKLDSSDIMVNDESGSPILLIDNSSAQFLRNSIVDYVEDLNGSRFVIKNPLAKSRCGCGNSFAL